MRTFLPALFWLLIITVLSVIPSVQLPNFQLFSGDKLAHAIVYATLVALLLWGARKWSVPLSQTGLVATVFAAAYGILMEFIQGAFIPGRFFEVDDMIANTFGCFLGWGLFLAGRRLRPATR